MEAITLSAPFIAKLEYQINKWSMAKAWEAMLAWEHFVGYDGIG